MAVHLTKQNDPWSQYNNIGCQTLECKGLLTADCVETVDVEAETLKIVNSLNTPKYIFPADGPGSAESALVSATGSAQLAFKSVPLLGIDNLIEDKYMPPVSLSETYVFTTIALRDAYVGPPAYAIGNLAIVTSDPTPGNNGNYTVQTTAPLVFQKLVDDLGVASLNGLIDSIELKSTSAPLTIAPSGQDINFSIDQALINHGSIADIGVNTHAQIDNHISSSIQHGVISSLVGVSDIQGLTNKTLTNPNNNIIARGIRSSAADVLVNSQPCVTNAMLLGLNATSARWTTDYISTLTGLETKNVGNKGCRIGIDSAGNPRIEMMRGADGTPGQAVAMYWDWGYTNQADFDFRWIMSNSQKLSLIPGVLGGTKTMEFGMNTNFTTTLTKAGIDVVDLSSAQTLSVKTLKTSCIFQDVAVPTKVLSMNLTGQAASTNNEFEFSSTVSRGYTFPDADGTVMLNSTMPLLGQEFQYFKDDPPVFTSSLTFVVARTYTTTVIPAGNYLINYTGAFGVDIKTSIMDVEFRVDGAVSSAFDKPTGVETILSSATSHNTFTFATAASHTLAYYFKTTAGIADICRVRIQIQRIP